MSAAARAPQSWLSAVGLGLWLAAASASAGITTHSSSLSQLSVPDNLSCLSVSYNQCGQGLPGNFCCASGTTCVVLAGNTTSLCCRHSSCQHVEIVSCDLSLQHVSSNPTAELLTTELQTPMPACGSQCCPFGYSCSQCNSNGTFVACCSMNANQTQLPSTPPEISPSGLSRRSDDSISNADLSMFGWFGILATLILSTLFSVMGVMWYLLYRRKPAKYAFYAIVKRCKHQLLGKSTPAIQVDSSSEPVVHPGTLLAPNDAGLYDGGLASFTLPSPAYLNRVKNAAELPASPVHYRHLHHQLSHGDLEKEDENSNWELESASPGFDGREEASERDDYDMELARLLEVDNSWKEGYRRDMLDARRKASNDKLRDGAYRPQPHHQHHNQQDAHRNRLSSDTTNVAANFGLLPKDAPAVRGFGLSGGRLSAMPTQLTISKRAPEHTLLSSLDSASDHSQSSRAFGTIAWQGSRPQAPPRALVSTAFPSPAAEVHSPAESRSGTHTPSDVSPGGMSTSDMSPIDGPLSLRAPLAKPFFRQPPLLAFPTPAPARQPRLFPTSSLLAVPPDSPDWTSSQASPPPMPSPEFGLIIIQHPSDPAVSPSRWHSREVRPESLTLGSVTHPPLQRPPASAAVRQRTVASPSNIRSPIGRFASGNSPSPLAARAPYSPTNRSFRHPNLRPPNADMAHLAVAPLFMRGPIANVPGARRPSLDRNTFDVPLTLDVPLALDLKRTDAESGATPTRTSMSSTSSFIAFMPNRHDSWL